MGTRAESASSCHCCQTRAGSSAREGRARISTAGAGQAAAGTLWRRVVFSSMSPRREYSPEKQLLPLHRWKSHFYFSPDTVGFFFFFPFKTSIPAQENHQRPPLAQPPAEPSCLSWHSKSPHAPCLLWESSKMTALGVEKLR